MSTLSESQITNLTSLDGTTAASGSTASSRKTECKILREKFNVILSAAQNEPENHTKLINNMKNIYMEHSKKLFAETLWRMMVIFFSSKDRHIYIENGIIFFHKILKKFGNLTLESSDEGETLDLKVLKLCVKYHNDSRVQVRVSIIDTMDVIFKTFEGITDLDETLVKKMVEAFLIRIKDKQAHVRLKSITILGRILKESFSYIDNKNIRRELCFHLKHDNSFEVRKAAVSNIALTRNELKDFLDKINDINENVRLSAYIAIKDNLDMRSIAIEERERVIICGFNDTSDKVKRAAEKVLMKWYTDCSNDVLLLLSKFDMGRESVCNIVVKNVLNSDLNMDNLNLNFLEAKLVPLDKQTDEKYFFWSYIVENYYSRTGYSELLTPDLHLFIDYIHQLMLQYDNKLDAAKRQSWSFKFRQTLNVLIVINIEEGGRLALQKLLREVFTFKYLQIWHTRPLMKLFLKCFPYDRDRNILEIFQTILDTSQQKENLSETNNPEENEEKIASLREKIAKITQERIALQNCRDAAVSNSDFIEAQSLKEKILKLTEELDLAKAQLKQLDPESAPSSSEDQEHSEEVSNVPTILPANAYKIIFATLQLYLRCTRDSTRDIAESIKDYIQHYSKQCIFANDDTLRILTLGVNTLLALFVDEPIHSELSMLFCLKALLGDSTKVKIKAIESIFDLILGRGFEYFNQFESLSNMLCGYNEKLNQSARRSSLLDEHDSNECALKLLIVGLYNSKELDVLEVVVTGTIKLFLCQRFYSPKIIKTLMALMVNPVNEASKIYHEIVNFIPLYISMGEKQANIVAEALLPCARKILCAPRDSPLIDASIEKLIGFVVNETLPSKLPFSNAYEVHYGIADVFLKEMYNIPGSPANAVYVKVLKGIVLAGCPRDRLEELLTWSDDVKKGETRSIGVSMSAFMKYVNNLIASLPNEEEEEEEANSDPMESDADAV